MMYSILSRFALEGRPIGWRPIGSGHINNTYRIETDADHPYILQRINDNVFRNVEGLMSNIVAVTEYQRALGRDFRHALTLVPTTDGAWYCYCEATEDVKAGYYRIYECVTDSICFDQPETMEDFRRSALAFGGFQMDLKDFPAEKLVETIPHFHDTVDRYAKFHRAIEEDVLGRAASVAPEIDFALEREAGAGEMLRLQAEGLLPLRVTHNDTKLSNILFDVHDRQPLCIIDLDTVMPGLVANDFGESIRYGASTAVEDEPDLSRVEMSLDRYEVYAGGFLEACGAALTKTEIETLPQGARMMSLENGVRFLTDYLQGDVYFHISRPQQNLDRARAQFKLVVDMEKKADRMNAFIRKIAK